MDDATKSGLAPALGAIPSGLFILFARHEMAGRSMLASWLQQTSFDPPMVTVALRQGRPMLEAVQASKRVSICILAEDNTDLLRHFAKGDSPSLAGIPHSLTPSGLPILTAAVAWLEGEAKSFVGAGDHELAMIEITGGAVLRADAKPKMHLRKGGFTY